MEIFLGTIVAPGGENETVDIEFRLRSTLDIRWFSIALEPDGGILIPLAHEIPSPRWDRHTWFWNVLDDTFAHTANPVIAYATPQTYLITNGKFVVHSYGCSSVLEAGEHTFHTMAWLPRNTKAGVYSLEVHPASEVVLSDGTVISPASSGPSTVEVERDVIAGYSGGMPPISGNMDSRTIDGKVEFRLVGAEGFPGDTVNVRLQVRMGTPVNQLYAQIQRPRGALECAGMEYLYRRPTGEEPELYDYEPNSFFCGDGTAVGPPYTEVLVYLTGANTNSAFNIGRPLEYFQPLGEWFDLLDIAFTISPSLPGGVSVPLRFFRDVEAGIGSVGHARREPAMFAPYLRDLPCPPYWDEMGGNWTYDVTYEGAFVKVLGESPGEPVPPEDYGIGFVLGDVSGAPGDVVEVPVLASSLVPLGLLRLALESDPDLFIEAMEVEVIDNRDLSTFLRVTQRGETFIYERCEGGLCTYSTPFVSFLYDDVEPEQALIDFIMVAVGAGGTERWLTDELREIARLHVRIAKGAVPRTTQLRPAKFLWSRDGSEVSSGGFANLFHYAFGPALGVEGGQVRITEGPLLIRGDCNGDGEVAGQVTDAVFLLNYSFLGGREPPCLAACDANADGLAAGQVTDAVYLLNFNFLGGPQPPAPFSDCGAASSLDEILGCAVESCP